MSQKSTRPTSPTRTRVTGLWALTGALLVGLLPAACQSGGVGDPCTPEDEFNSEFAGFDMAEENIESRAFQCETRICLVNHFQGRVSCPLGQAPPDPCASPEDTSCGEGRKCVEAATPSSECDAASSGEGAASCKRYVCHTPGSCQSAAADEAGNRGKSCCVPGTDTPVAVPVCGQCSASSNRDADRAVYCSCRCGPPEGTPRDENVNYCECPGGFECAEIRKDFNLGDKQLAGKYCVKQGTVFESKQSCGEVKDYFSPDQCSGLGTSG